MHALKGQKLLAQGNALGIRMNIKVRPERAKALDVGFMMNYSMLKKY